MFSSDMITQVQNNINRADVSRPQILRWMNDRKEQVCNYDNFTFMELTSQAVTTAAQQAYIIPDDYKAELQVWLNDGVTKYYLDKWVGTQAENSYSNNNVQAKPYAYWVWQDSFFLYPIPDREYTIDLKYYGYMDDFTDAATEENTLNRLYPDLIIKGATADGFHFFQQDDKTAEWEGKWDKEFQRLIRRESHRVYTNYTPRVRLRIR